MKLLIISFFSFLISLSAFAGGNSGSGGTRPGMGMLSSALAGVGGGGTVGSEKWRLSLPQERKDFVQAIQVNDKGMAKFKYKAFDNPNIEIQEIHTSDLNDAYREAIGNSLKTKQWTSVIAE